MKKILCLLAIMMLFSVAFADNFSDVSKTHWAYDTINEMKEKGFVHGYEDGTFKPENEVTREEFCQMMLNVTKAEMQKNPISYEDVSEDRWSYDAVQIIGRPLADWSCWGTIFFYPTFRIQRQEVAVILSDFYELGKDYTETDLDFEDVTLIDAKHVEAIAHVYSAGLMHGMSDTEFSPTSTLTRAQAATLLCRIYNKQQEEQTTSKTTENSSDLDFAFLKLENDKKNLIYSPLSIEYALSMLNEGAGNNTRKEIEALLANKKLTKYKNIDKVLSLANSVYIRDTYKEYVIDEFKNTIKEKYDAEIIIDEFKDAKNVNNWIENKTFGIIKNMVKDELVQDPNLAMLLINALAIDMEWESNFPFEKTHGENFTKADGKKITTTMMQKEVYGDSTSVYVDDSVKAVSMDLKEYDGTRLEFVAVMPSGSLENYIKEIDSDKINELRAKLVPASEETNRITVKIPKFKFNYSLKLKQDLIALGMKEAFDNYLADFTNMSNNPRGLFVSEALHKADIDFSEKGIKAAAVTVFAMMEKTAFIIDKPIEITFDKPFLFIIRDKENGDIWFVGTVYEPNLWENDKADYEVHF